MSLSSWLVAGIVPGVERQPLKKLAVDESALLKLLHRWREEAEKAGRRIERIVVAFEAGRDGFWLAHHDRSAGDKCPLRHWRGPAAGGAPCPRIGDCDPAWLIWYGREAVRSYQLF